MLRDNGFTVEDGVAGIPTAWVARWGSGKPVIAFGSDVDGIPQASQKPGVAYRDPIVEGAPGHGEGHNSGTPLNIVAALAVKRIMEREKLPGTLMIWPGVAEELLGTKAYFVRAGLFKDVDVVLYNHVGANLGTSWGDGGGSGLVSVEYTFEGETAHSAGGAVARPVGARRRGADERRLELSPRAPAPAQRSHYVITNGGDQPNVVPRNASVWYYFRETDYETIRNMWDIGDKMAQGAALMTNTKWTSRVLGSAWPRTSTARSPRPCTPTSRQVGLPQWSDADITLAKATQRSWGCRRWASPPASAALRGPRDDPGRGEAAAAPPTTSATSPGPCRRCRCASRPTSRPVRATTGPTPSRWRRRSRTRA